MAKVVGSGRLKAKVVKPSRLNISNNDNFMVVSARVEISLRPLRFILVSNLGANTKKQSHTCTTCGSACSFSTFSGY
jgi:hypothetical protein